MKTEKSVVTGLVEIVQLTESHVAATDARSKPRANFPNRVPLLGMT